LSALAGARRIVLHDLDRPLLSEAAVLGMLTASGGAPMAVGSLPARNTYKEVRDGMVVRTIDRAHLVVLQPPWIAERSALEEILDRLGARPSVMGSLMAGCRAAGISVRFLAGDPCNIPVRTDSNARFAEQIWPSR
jgi:2-C-methyl-D-erythritol 4-phosphate cytidylyltransferase